MLIDSSAAVITKARAKYGKRLTEKDYKALLKCNNVASVVSYLKAHTKYADVLSKLNENEVHRGRVESLLKQKVFYDFDSLCRYEMSQGSPFSEFIIRRYEIEQLIHFLLLLSCNKQEQYIFALPSYFNKHTDIDLYKLSACKDFESFINALGKGEYCDILKEFAPDKDGIIDIAGAEDALNVYSYKKLYIAISKRKSKKQKENLKSLCDYINDFCNISRILRLKKYYNMDESAIRSHLMPFGSINKKTIDSMCEAKDVDEVFDIVATTRIGKRIKQMSIEKEEQLSIKSRYNMCKRMLYYSNDPAVVLLSYMYVSEAELKNIITIVEGVRYNCSAQQIESMLIYEY
ncbi:MAG: V-type ATPase subunit [Ruminococcus sp.]|nr:V-type ATPase subunit [Ruminococcus sp.]